MTGARRNQTTRTPKDTAASCDGWLLLYYMTSARYCIVKPEPRSVRAQAKPLTKCAPSYHLALGSPLTLAPSASNETHRHPSNRPDPGGGEVL
eukprot:CAMPEP_0185203908 /NCGR_PEP_ID=MMETSP1140-20130426/53877_1 /TAXON_ID=298111 /ORGANISM="Pavlova sp., Strain CCMP459" /LENGTH=92 /DNA_ID=CAMNT_0027771429 /DNA_START=8 /DNA_END=286 /DNA_ORIENTATION=-